MRKCIVCQQEYQETTKAQKYCDRTCKRAAYLKMSREQYIEHRREGEKRFAEEVRRAGEAGYGNCVIFRDDGGYNRQYLTADGAWTVNREEAARCRGTKEADDLAERSHVTFFGGVSEAEPSCDILTFRDPDAFNKWLANNWGEIDADDANETERIAQADFDSELADLVAAERLRRGKAQEKN